MSQITVRALEEKIFELEEIVVVIRAPSSDLVEEYPYERKAAGNATIVEWVEQRIKPCVKGVEFTIINGDYSTPHGRTKLSTLRQGYEK